MTDCLVVLMTASSADEGERLATVLVEEQLAACVNIVAGVRSIYRWAGQLQRDEECLLIAKTRATAFEALAARVRALHTYATPEIIALPITAGSQTYLDWLTGVVRQ